MRRQLPTPLRGDGLWKWNGGTISTRTASFSHFAFRPPPVFLAPWRRFSSPSSFSTSSSASFPLPVLTLPSSPSVFSPWALAGVSAVVSGGTGALGSAVALHLALHGAHVAVLSRALSRATAVTEAIGRVCEEARETDWGGRGAGQWKAPQLLPVECDVQSAEGVDRALKGCHSALSPPPSLLLLCHGVVSDSLTARQGDEALDAVVSTNLLSCIRLIRASSRSLLSAPPHCPRRIVILGSIVSGGAIGQVAYAASKAGLRGVVGSVSREMARAGVTVNLLEVGWIGAGMGGRMEGETRRRWEGRLAERDWMARPGTVDDAAAMALFLCTPAANYVTGQHIAVHGGLRL